MTVDESTLHPLERRMREFSRSIHAANAVALERRRIRFYAKALRTHGLSPEFIVEALSDPAWPLDSRDRP